MGFQNSSIARRAASSIATVQDGLHIAHELLERWRQDVYRLGEDYRIAVGRPGFQRLARYTHHETKQADDW